MGLLADGVRGPVSYLPTPLAGPLCYVVLHLRRQDDQRPKSQSAQNPQDLRKLPTGSKLNVIEPYWAPPQCRVQMGALMGERTSWAAGPSALSAWEAGRGRIYAARSACSHRPGVAWSGPAGTVLWPVSGPGCRRVRWDPRRSAASPAVPLPGWTPDVSGSWWEGCAVLVVDEADADQFSDVAGECFGRLPTCRDPERGRLSLCGQAVTALG